MSLLIVKNNTNDNKVYYGQLITSGSEHVVDDTNRDGFSRSENLLNDILSGDVIVNNGSNDITDKSKAIDYLKGLSVHSIKIQEEETATGGHYQIDSFDINIGATSGWHYNDYSFPFPVSILSAKIFPLSENQGDMICFLIGPDTIVGTLTSNVSAGDIIINVSSTVIANTKIGFNVNLYNGSDQSYLGRVVSAGDTQLVMETSASQGFEASTPTYVRQSVSMMPCMTIPTTRMDLGDSKIGGSYLPAGTIFRARYNNISTGAKTFTFYIEYLY